MEKYLHLIAGSYSGYAGWLWREITFSNGNPWWHNYFWWLIVLSAFFLMLEWMRPWRKTQARFRKDFWLDFFYMFFNFFIFSLIIFAAYQNVLKELFADALKPLGISAPFLPGLQSWPTWAYFLVLFLTADFLQWNIHRLLHKVPWLWEFHKVHHSVEQMGFAAHLRYHWMENIVYKTLQFIPLTLLGYDLVDLFIVHIFSLAIGHFNHSNFKLNLGPLKYIFNNPQMHIWHHAWDLPPDKPYGVNFGLTLSIWDYVFGLAYIPFEGRDIRLGFPDLERFPDDFAHQNLHGILPEKLTLKPLPAENKGKAAPTNSGRPG